MLNVIADWFRWLYDATGINFTIFYSSYDASMFFHGVIISITLTIICIAAAICVGVVGAALQESRLAPARWFIQGIITVFRNTPPLIQLFFFFFVVGGMLQVPTSDGFSRPLIGNYWWAIITLSFYFGCFNIEAFRASIEAVPREMVEAGEALGYSRLGAYWHIMLPIAFRFSLPALGNNLVGLAKATSLAYAIAVPEVLYVSSQIWNFAFNVPEMMNVLLVYYLLLVAVVVWGMRILERRLKMPGYTV